MEQQALFEQRVLYDRTPPGTYWRHFSPDTARAQARVEFIRIYGVPPAQVLRVPNMVLAGPVPGRGGEVRP